MQEIAHLEKKLSEPQVWQDPAKIQEINIRLAELKKTIKTFSELSDKFADVMVLYDFFKVDKTVEKELYEQINEISQKISTLEFITKLSGKNDQCNAIITLHAGAGGTEACDWTEMLLRMYTRWAQNKGFAVQVTDLSPGESVGIKSITFIVRGQYAYGLLKCEIGVHRLVRISPFDANKRRHTSFASCDVIPEIEDEIEIKIDEKDIRIDTFRASGHGGQHLQKADSAVRIVHLPTGLIVQCQNERSQYKNKMTALKILKSRLYELEQEKKRTELEKHYNEKGEIAWGNQIRSYIFMPYKLVKDHRTGKEFTDISAVMDGHIDPFIEAYLDYVLTKKT